MFILIQPFPHWLKPLITYLATKKRNKVKLFIVSNFNTFSACVWGLHRDYPCIIHKGVIKIMKYFSCFIWGKSNFTQTFVFAQFFLLFQFSGALEKVFSFHTKNIIYNEWKGFWECDGVREVEILFIFFFSFSLQTISHV